MTPKRKKSLLATSVVWLALVSAAIYFPSAAVMRGPRDDREAYVYSWSFQIGARALVDGPPFVGALAVTLILEWVAFDWFSKRRQPVDRSPD